MALSLKNKVAIVSCSIVTILLFNCSHKQENSKTFTKSKNDSASCSKAPLNPNGDSELALLMREMLDSAKSFKEMIKAGKVPDKFPEAFLKIHTAKPTDNETKKSSFDGYADGYLSSLKNLASSGTSNAKLNYNAVVQACENCHSEHCPGPLSAIRKLKL